MKQKRKNFDPDALRQDIQTILDERAELADRRAELADRRATAVVHKILDQLGRGKYNVNRAGTLQVVFYCPHRLEDQDVERATELLREVGLKVVFRWSWLLWVEDWRIKPFREPP